MVFGKLPALGAVPFVKILLCFPFLRLWQTRPFSDVLLVAFQVGYWP